MSGVYIVSKSELENIFSGLFKENPNNYKVSDNTYDYRGYRFIVDTLITTKKG